MANEHFQCESFMGPRTSVASAERIFSDFSDPQVSRELVFDWNDRSIF